MSRISGWFRQFSAKLSAALRSFMTGRYGTDRLNMVILCAGLFVSLLSMWIRVPALNMLFFVLSYGLMIWAICRSLSRNTYRRYMENRRFFQLTEQIKGIGERLGSGNTTTGESGGGGFLNVESVKALPSNPDPETIYLVQGAVVMS